MTARLLAFGTAAFVGYRLYRWLGRAADQILSDIDRRLEWR